jgi:hypothetical protein
MVAPKIQAKQRKMLKLQERWKFDSEAGATYFALDALAGCPAQLD